MRVFCLSLVLIAGLWSTGARAASLYLFEGDFTINSTFGGFPAPQSFSFTATYDTDLGFLSGTDTQNIVASSVILNGVTYDGDTSGLAVFQDQVPFSPPRDRFSISDGYDVDFAGMNIEAVGVSYEGPDDIFAQADLPIFPDLEDFTIQSVGFVRFTGGGCAFPACVVQGEITEASLTQVTMAPVPLPAGFPLLAAALGSLAYLRRRR